MLCIWHFWLIGYWLLAGSRGPCWFSWFFSAFFAFRRGHKTQDSQRTTVAHQNDSTKPKHDADAACGTWHVARGTWHVARVAPKAQSPMQSPKPKAQSLLLVCFSCSTQHEAFFLTPIPVLAVLLPSRFRGHPRAMCEVPRCAHMDCGLCVWWMWGFCHCHLRF